MRDERPSALTAEERSLLDELLAHDFAGVAALRDQSRSVLARKGCDCGCGTIDFIATSLAAVCIMMDTWRTCQSGYSGA